MCRVFSRMREFTAQVHPAPISAFVCACMRLVCLFASPPRLPPRASLVCLFAGVCLFVCLFICAEHGCARAGKLAWGVQGANACPAGSSVINDAAQCQAAAATAGQAWAGSFSFSNEPRGCYWVTGSGSVGLNTHPTGAAHPKDQLLCAVPATGLRAHVRVKE